MIPPLLILGLFLMAFWATLITVALLTVGLHWSVGLAALALVATWAVWVRVCPNEKA